LRKRQEAGKKARIGWKKLKLWLLLGRVPIHSNELFSAERNFGTEPPRGDGGAAGQDVEHGGRAGRADPDPGPHGRRARGSNPGRKLQAVEYIDLRNKQITLR